ncbi:hypothetical protein [Tessaracoccus aquimaris]|uniref:hypothetical protein n=1 Tax=Tessaracoccus aquimaris TaxID=1332264 RepID=UPI001D05281F|nr:hypothetical protein [Tessaracoccus aquimaris]
MITDLTIGSQENSPKMSSSGRAKTSVLIPPPRTQFLSRAPMPRRRAGVVVLLT